MIQCDKYTDHTYGCTELVLEEFGNMRKAALDLKRPDIRTKDRAQSLDVLMTTSMGDPNLTSFHGYRKQKRVWGFQQKSKNAKKRKIMATDFWNEIKARSSKKRKLNTKRRSSLFDDTKWDGSGECYGEEMKTLLRTVFESGSKYIYRDRQNRKWDHKGESKELKSDFMYGIHALDSAELRQKLLEDEELMGKVREISANLPSSKWIEDKVRPPNCWYFKKRGEDSGANSIITPASYNYDAIRSFTVKISPKAAEELPLTIQEHFEEGICKTSKPSNNKCDFHDQFVI